MKPYHLTGLTAKIANRIGTFVYRNSPGHIEAAALAVMSSMTGCRYSVARPVRPHSDPNGTLSTYNGGAINQCFCRPSFSNSTRFLRAASLSNLS